MESPFLIRDGFYVYFIFLCPTIRNERQMIAPATIVITPQQLESVEEDSTIVII